MTRAARRPRCADGEDDRLGDPKLLRRAQWRRGRRSGSGGVKTGASVAGTPTRWSKWDAPRFHRLPADQPAVGSLGDLSILGEADRSLLTVSERAKRNTFEFERGSGSYRRCPGPSYAWHPLKHERKKARHIWSEQLQGGAWRRLDPITEHLLTKADEAGHMWLSLDVDDEQAAALSEPLARCRVRIALANLAELRELVPSCSRKARRRERHRKKEEQEQEEQGQGPEEEDQSALPRWERRHGSQLTASNERKERKEPAWVRYRRVGKMNRRQYCCAYYNLRSASQPVSGKSLIPADELALPEEYQPTAPPPGPASLLSDLDLDLDLERMDSPAESESESESESVLGGFLSRYLWLRIFAFVDTGDSGLRLGLLLSRELAATTRRATRSLRVPVPALQGLRQQWPLLRSLALINAQLGGLRCLLDDTDLCGRLRVLNLAHNGLCEAGLLELAAAAPQLQSLRRLSLRGNPVESSDVLATFIESVAVRRPLPALRVLDLGEMLAHWGGIWPLACRAGRLLVLGCLPKLRLLNLDERGPNAGIRHPTIDGVGMQLMQRVQATRGGRFRLSVRGLRELQLPRLPEAVRSAMGTVVFA